MSTPSLFYEHTECAYEVKVTHCCGHTVRYPSKNPDNLPEANKFAKLTPCDECIFEAFKLDPFPLFSLFVDSSTIYNLPVYNHKRYHSELWLTNMLVRVFKSNPNLARKCLDGNLPMNVTAKVCANLFDAAPDLAVNYIHDGRPPVSLRAVSKALSIYPEIVIPALIDDKGLRGTLVRRYVKDLADAEVPPAS